MSKLNEMIDMGLSHHLVFKNRRGKTFLRLPLIWAVVLTVAAPQLLLAVLFFVAIELVEVTYDDQVASAGRGK